MSVSGPYKAAVVGLGKIGLEFDLESGEDEVFTHTKAYMAHKGFTLVGGVDLHDDKRAGFEKYSGVKAYDDAEEMFAVTRPDVVSICVPIANHLNTFMEVVRHRPKLILMEKPAGASMEEARRMREAAKEQGVTVYVNYIRRGDPAVNLVKEWLASGRHGAPLGVNVYYSNGVYSNAAHYINVMNYFFGVPFSISMLRGKKNVNRPGDFAADFLLSHDGFDARFTAVDEGNYSIGEFDILLSSARMRFVNYFREVEFYKVAQDPLFPAYKSLTREEFPASSGMKRYQYHILDHVVAALENESANNSGIDSAIETIQVCDEIRRQYEAEKNETGD